MKTYVDEEAVFDSAITIPEDGDDITAASVNVPLEALADRTRYLSEFCPIAIDKMATFGNTGDLLGATDSTAWEDIAIIAGTCLSYTDHAAQVPALRPTDVLRVKHSFYAKASQTDSFECRLVLRDHVTVDDIATPSLTANALIDVDSGQRMTQHCVYVSGLLDATGIIAANIDVVLQAKALTANGSTLNIYAPTLTEVRVIRR